MAIAFLNIKFSSSRRAFLFWSSLICLAEIIESSSSLTSENCLIHLAIVEIETPYFLESWDWDLPAWYKEIILFNITPIYS